MAGIALKRSRQAPAEDTPSFGAIAERFRRAGDLDRAIALCQEGLKKFPNQLSARVTLGWSFLDKGEYDLARTELERVLRRAPDNLAAIRGLAELHDRAEHSVSGLSPDGTWTAPEETAEEPAPLPVAPPASEPTILPPATPPAALRSVPAEAPAAPMPPAPLPVPVIASVPSAEAANPLSLIETPAQAAIAHSGEPVAQESVSEQVLDQPAVVVDAVPAEPEAVTPAFEEIVPELPRLEPDLAVDDVNAWDLAGAQAALTEALNESEAEPVLLAENADIELAAVANEWTMVASDPELEGVIDLPSVDGALEGALLQFEEPAAFEAEALDPVLPAPPEVAATVELVNDAAALVAIEPEPMIEAAAVVVADPEPMMDAAALETADTEPMADAPVFVAPHPEPATDVAAFVAADPEPATGPSVFVGIEQEPEIEVAQEPESAPGPEPVSEAVAAFEDASASEPARPLEAIEDQIGLNVGDAVIPPEVAWLPPAVVNGHDVAAATPVAAAAAVQVADAHADLFSMSTKSSPPVRPGPAAPIAALEAFLQKVSARRLHLTPGSVA
jgi:hypothetical protein